MKTCPHTGLPLVLRPCVIGSEPPAPDDYSIYAGDVLIGRVHWHIERAYLPEPWGWSINCRLKRTTPYHSGSGKSLDEAKVGFLQSWSRCEPDIDAQRAAQAIAVAAAEEAKRLEGAPFFYIDYLQRDRWVGTTTIKAVDPADAMRRAIDSASRPPYADEVVVCQLQWIELLRQKVEPQRSIVSTFARRNE